MTRAEREVGDHGGVGRPAPSAVGGCGGVRDPRQLRPRQTASLFEVKWKSWARIAGTVSAKNSLPAGVATLVASRFLSRLTGLSLNRKLLTG